MSACMHVCMCVREPQSTAPSVLVPGHQYPAGHCPVHVDEVRPPVDPYVPARQAPEQAAEGRPVTLPYSPALQSVQEADPAREYFPVGHSKEGRFRPEVATPQL